MRFSSNGSRLGLLVADCKSNNDNFSWFFQLRSPSNMNVLRIVPLGKDRYYFLVALSNEQFLAHAHRRSLEFCGLDSDEQLKEIIEYPVDENDGISGFSSAALIGEKCLFISDTMIISMFSKVLTFGCFMLLLLLPVTTAKAIQSGNYKIKLLGNYVNQDDNKMYRYLLDDVDPQTWAVDKLSNGMYTIKNLATNKFIPAPKDSPEIKYEPIMLGDTKGSFQIVDDFDDGLYTIKGANTDLFLGKGRGEDRSLLPKPVGCFFYKY
ncbi:unnamed protein product [Adineta steineri]|uniref:Ricin B lectin domain-containing protein n=2 Tax=Adineta steineri TaxID=433720 RepID=A0A818WUY0_9BILA|nr:unnamed protein product [Adineta steineri]